MKEHVIYGLKDPRDGRLRYVGVTCYTLSHRLKCHLSNARRGDKPRRCKWIRLLLSLDLRPIIFVIESIHADQRIEREQYWIRFYRESGLDLTNGTDGGDGLLNLSPEIRARIGAAHRGKVMSPESRERMSKARKGVPRGPFSAETRAKISAWHRGRVFTPEHREKLRAAAKNRPPDPERIAKMAAANRGRKRTPEVVANVVRSRRS